MCDRSLEVEIFLVSMPATAPGPVKHKCFESHLCRSYEGSRIGGRDTTCEDLPIALHIHSLSGRMFLGWT